MNFWKKIAILSVITIAIFLFQGISNIAPARAALYKYTFTGDGVNGYMIYDDSIEGNENAPFQSPFVTAYYGAGIDYEIDLGTKGSFQGNKSNPIVYLPRLQQDDLLTKLKTEHDEQYGDDTYDVTSPADFLLLQVRSYERKPQSLYTLDSYFKYPAVTFDNSTDFPTTVPSNAEIAVFPEVDFPKTLGEPLFVGNVQTKIEKISD